MLEDTSVLLCIAMLIMMGILSVSSVAFATNQGSQNHFDQHVASTTPGDDRCLNYEWSTAKQVRAARLYVRHYLYNGPYNGTFTNLFKCQSYERGALLMGENDWMAPGEANYIRSNSIALYEHFKVWGRANDKYSYNTIQISGYMAQDG